LAAGMPQFLTVHDQTIWSERIHKEASTARTRNEFSVRNAVSILDVPKQFKPGHIDPSSKSHAEKFNPRKVGWDPKGQVATEFRRCIDRQTAGSRERHQFPDTMYQEVGWSQGQSGDPQQRAEPYGSNPSKLGIGWLQKDGHGLLMALAGKKEDPDRVYEEAHAPRQARGVGGVRERHRAAPFGTSVPTAEFPASEAAPARSRSAASLGAPEAGGRNAQAQRSSSVSATDSLRELAHQEAALNGAMRHSSKFLNRHKSNQWYHPLCNSDVAIFADHYNKCLGVQLYAKQGR